jgi:TrmH family RNA methyltransferase
MVRQRFGKGAATPAREARSVPTELGAHHPRLERIRALRTARGRREQARFAIEGHTLIAEAGRSGVAIRELYAVAERLAEHPEAAALEGPGLPVFLVSARVYGRLSDVTTPPGLLAVVDFPTVDAAAILGRPGPVLLLAGVNDPGNAGTLLRSAEAFGAAGALFGQGGVDPYSPKVVRAAMGALFRLPVAAVAPGGFAAAAAAAGRAIVAADTDGADIADVELPGSVILAVGNERRGVRDWLDRWDTTVRIPHRGPAESLNAAVAGSILLYLLSRRNESCQ